jgi:hypothetical protein
MNAVCGKRRENKPAKPLFSIDEVTTCGEVIAAKLLGLTPKVEEK